MAIYRVKIRGRQKSVLVKAANKTEALDLFVEAAALTAEGMQEALDAGERVWKPGEELPEDEPAEEPGDEAGAAGPAGGDEPLAPPPDEVKSTE